MADSRKKGRGGGGRHPIPQEQEPNVEGRGKESRPSSVTMRVAESFELRRRGPIPDAEELVGFACATFLVATGHGVEGTVMFGLDVVALVSAFILGRSKADQQQ